MKKISNCDCNNILKIDWKIDAESGELVSFANMKERTVQCALWMRNHLGVGPDDVVTICTDNQPDDYVPVLATLYLGAIYNPWYYGLDLREFFKVTFQFVVWFFLNFL